MRGQRHLRRPSPTAAVVLAFAAAVATALGVLFWPITADKTAVAYFPEAVHLYPGSPVDVLGIPVGQVRSVTPQGTDVRVVIAYRAATKVPARVHAVIVEPTLVADRVVQLTPVYSGGAVLRDGATIPLARNDVPLELDQLVANLNQLAVALGPHGANSAGALSRALQVGAANLTGQGAAMNRTLTQTAALAGTLAGSRDQLFGMVDHLQQFVAALAAHDAQTRKFTSDLAAVSAQLSGERADFSAAVGALQSALADVSSFIRGNRSALSTDVGQLASVTRVLAQERTLLGWIVDMGAVGVSNYPHMYTPSVQTYNARFDFTAQQNPALFFCQLYESVGGSGPACAGYLAPLKSLPLPSGGAP